MKKLTNKQMSLIVGGAKWFCTYKVDNNQSSSEIIDEVTPIGPSLYVFADSAVEAADIVHNMYGSSQVNCTKVND